MLSRTCEFLSISRYGSCQKKQNHLKLFSIGMIIEASWQLSSWALETLLTCELTI